MFHKTYTIFIILTLFILTSLNSFAENKKGITIALLADVAGVKDNSFNQLIYNGLLNVTKKYKNVTLKVYASDNSNDYLAKLSSIGQDKYDIVVTSGILMYDSTVKASKAYPNTKFIAIDDEFSPEELSKNLIGITFDEYQSGYLAGVFAGAMTVKYHTTLKGLNADNKLGIIQGMDILPIRRYSDGFRDGVKSSCKECVVVTSLLGSFTNSENAEKLANSMYHDGADILFLLAGPANIGAISSARLNNKYVIGADDDQNHIAPKFVLTSATKRLDLAIEKIIGDYVTNNLEFGKNYKFTVKDNSIDLAPFHKFENIIPEEVKSLINNAKADIISGKIQSN